MRTYDILIFEKTINFNHKNYSLRASYIHNENGNYILLNILLEAKLAALSLENTCKF
jgi:hypothetical protein